MDWLILGRVMFGVAGAALIVRWIRTVPAFFDADPELTLCRDPRKMRVALYAWGFDRAVAGGFLIALDVGWDASLRVAIPAIFLPVVITKLVGRRLVYSAVNDPPT